ncbi:hypothetical protein [Streptomyces cacaoi]|uniref:hypothetical protein n=1 Tax=Streptomyces cacaoi TaxID=1898 RepID=UPI00374A0D15
MPDRLLNGGDDGSAYGSVQTAIRCGDVPALRDPDVHWRDVQRCRARQPLVGPFTDDITPCAFRDRPRERATAVRDDLPALLAARGPWPGSRRVAVTGSDRHGVHGAYGNARVDGTVNAYLRTEEQPAAGEPRGGRWDLRSDHTFVRL